jgi:ketosteroid isomerase-like protein
LCLFFIACSSQRSIPVATASEVLDQWHAAASETDFDTYFGLMTSDAVFIGTDAGENWQRAEFAKFARPYFDRGQAWSFTALERNVYKTNDIVYFDELLDTQMGLCRGSGILKMEDNQLKIAHYVLSIAVPNDNVAGLLKLKKDWDDRYIKKLKESR